MQFKDELHEQFYNECVKRAGIKNDPYRQAFFYIIGLTDDTRKHIDSLYNFAKSCISFDGLNAPWQTGGSIKITRLAYNLYNGFSGEIDDDTMENPDYYTPYELFDTGLMKYLFEGVKLRFPEHWHSYAD